MHAPELMRCARGMLDLTQKDLAERACLSLKIVRSAEAGNDVRVSVLRAIEEVFADAGVVVLASGDVRGGGPGIRFRE